MTEPTINVFTAVVMLAALTLVLLCHDFQPLTKEASYNRYELNVQRVLFHK